MDQMRWKFSGDEKWGQVHGSGAKLCKKGPHDLISYKNQQIAYILGILLILNIFLCILKNFNEKH